MSSFYNAKIITALVCAVLCFSEGTFGDTNYPVTNESGLEGLSSVFELDTRGEEWVYLGAFVLDTRDAGEHADWVSSGLFTLDTRMALDPVTRLFTLDTRDDEENYAPTNVHARAEQLTVARITWEYYGEPLGFLVERRLPMGTWESVATPGAGVRAWLDAEVESGVFYEYRVAALLDAGVSSFSEISRIQMPCLPQAPSALAATLTDAGKPALAWSDESHNETGFDVWRKTDNFGAWESLSRVGSNCVSYLDHAVEPDTIYAYKVRSYNSWGYSAFSEEVDVVTPSEGGGCGYLLRVDQVGVTIDETVALTNELNRVNKSALVSGSLGAFVSSPRGNPHPIRVVSGFRDAQGRAVGTPVELIDFYCIPGCPGLYVTTVIPPDVRGPDSGTNTLWLEMIMAQRDPVKAFMTERHTQESPMRKRLFDVVVQPADTRQIDIQMLDQTVEAGAVVEVPVQMQSAGGEYLVAFSLAFDQGLDFLGATVGTNAQQGWLQTSSQSDRSVGFGMMMPFENPLADGSKQVMVLRFRGQRAGEYTIRFNDDPVARTVSGGGSDAAQISWRDGHLHVTATGLEGDIHPRPNGNGQVNEQDARQALLFALGVVEQPTEAAEFQRLDCAPVETCGDGVIDIADVVAIQRYALGEQALKSACGPTGAWSAVQQRTTVSRQLNERTILLEPPAEVRRGVSFSVPVVLLAQGDEHGLSLSIDFDPGLFGYQTIELLGAATNGHFLPNFEQASEGIIAFGLTLTNGETFSVSTQRIAEITFTALAGAGIETGLFGFAESPAECVVAGANSVELPAVWLGAGVTIFDEVSVSAPVPPKNAMASALSTNKIKLSWNDAPFSTGYRIRRKAEGESAWSVLTELDESRTVLVDDGLEAGTAYGYLLTSLNPLGDESSAISLSAVTWTPVEQWRAQQFGQVNNTGEAADSEDPDDDGIPNRMEYQLGTDPMVPNENPFLARWEPVFSGEQSLTITYDVLNEAPGNVSFELSEDLTDLGSWRTGLLAPVTRKTDNAGEQIKMRIEQGSLSNDVFYLRMRAE
jgi:hypothetical protein